MLTKTKIAFAAVALLSLADASAASASGGFVMPGSMDGVNPAYHPDWFPSHADGSGHDSGRDAYASTKRSKVDRVRCQNAFGFAGRVSSRPAPQMQPQWLN